MSDTKGRKAFVPGGTAFAIVSVTITGQREVRSFWNGPNLNVYLARDAIETETELPNFLATLDRFEAVDVSESATRVLSRPVAAVLNVVAR